MGQAKRRGTFEQRLEQALNKKVFVDQALNTLKARRLAVPLHRVKCIAGHHAILAMANALQTGVEPVSSTNEPETSLSNSSPTDKGGVKP